ncbi:hypothetical protein CW712_05140 [Candidatus Bathyarchaeota archaeon]|nr:MAG: hypothetical protein CW712_05140 [Candidatus Bathyarchaeota archaeon]
MRKTDCLRQGGSNVDKKQTNNSKLAELTASMVLSLVFFTAVFWIFPLIPIVITLMFEWPFTSFVSLWLAGLPFTAIAFYYIFRVKK